MKSKELITAQTHLYQDLPDTLATVFFEMMGDQFCPYGEALLEQLLADINTILNIKYDLKEIRSNRPDQYLKSEVYLTFYEVAEKLIESITTQTSVAPMGFAGLHECFGGADSSTDDFKGDATTATFRQLRNWNFSPKKDATIKAGFYEDEMRGWNTDFSQGYLSSREWHIVENAANVYVSRDTYDEQTQVFLDRVKVRRLLGDLLDINQINEKQLKKKVENFLKKNSLETQPKIFEILKEELENQEPVEKWNKEKNQAFVALKEKMKSIIKDQDTWISLPTT